MADLIEDDWSWTPARPGRIRSGTASVTPPGRLKLRQGAVWVDPQYQARHDYLVNELRRAEFRRSLAPIVVQVLGAASEPMSARQITLELDLPDHILESQALTAVRSTLSKLHREGSIISTGRRGAYSLPTPPVE